MKVYSLIEDDEIVVGLEVEEGTVNFSRMGTLFQILNQIIPFSNVAVQGPAKIFRLSCPKWMPLYSNELGRCSSLWR